MALAMRSPPHPNPLPEGEGSGRRATVMNMLFDRYRVTTEQYRTRRRDGYLVVPGLLPSDDADELRRHTDELMQGRLSEQRTQMGARDVARDGGVTVQDLEAPPAQLAPLEKAQYFLRIHMLHRKLA